MPPAWVVEVWGANWIKKTLISYFNFIREDWKTGEM